MTPYLLTIYPVEAHESLRVIDASGKSRRIMQHLGSLHLIQESEGSQFLVFVRQLNLNQAVTVQFGSASKYALVLHYKVQKVSQQLRTISIAES